VLDTLGWELGINCKMLLNKFLYRKTPIKAALGIKDSSRISYRLLLSSLE
jgi:hypothetical protein